MTPVPGLNIEPPREIPALRVDSASGEDSAFADQLRAALAPVVESTEGAKVELGRVLRGESDDLHNLQIATEKSALMTQLTMQVRNKLIDAYREIMQMSV